jgi:hypothetical protein
MIQTREGGFVIVGSTSSFDGGEQKGYFVLTDSAGNMLWSKVYGVNGEGLDDIVQTADGFAMVGITYAYAVGDRDVWLVKTDADGNQQWYKTYGYWGGEVGYALIQTFDGGYALACDTMSISAGEADFWLVKTDSLGNHLWDKTYGGTDWDSAYALVQTSDGGYAMAGFTNSYGTSTDAWLIKTDAAGNALDGFKYGLGRLNSQQHHALQRHRRRLLELRASPRMESQRKPIIPTFLFFLSILVARETFIVVVRHRLNASPHSF